MFSHGRKSLLPFAILLTIALLFVACGGSNTPTVQKKPTPTIAPTAGTGQQILMTMANKLNSAQTTHGEFDTMISGQTLNGIANTEVWNEKPNKSRSVVLKSSLQQLSVGTINVSNGKEQWQYDPTKKVVYTGAVTTTSSGTPTSGRQGSQGSIVGQNNQSLFLLNFVLGVFTQSDGTLKSSNDTVNGHSVYDIAVVPSTSNAGTGGPSNFDYSGDVFIDKTTMQAVKVTLNVQGVGSIVLNIPMLQLNQNIPESTFSFVVPAGVKVLPFSQLTATAGSGTGTLTLVQAQQQAGYHLLSIPSSQSSYTLSGVDALGAPGNQTYTLNYMKGSTALTISQGKPLANLSATGQSVSLRSTTGTIMTSNGLTSLAWTEKGVGIRISSTLSSTEVLSIAKSLS